MDYREEPEPLNRDADAWSKLAERYAKERDDWKKRADKLSADLVHAIDRGYDNGGTLNVFCSYCKGNNDSGAWWHEPTCLVTKYAPAIYASHNTRGENGPCECDVCKLDAAREEPKTP